MNTRVEYHDNLKVISFEEAKKLDTYDKYIYENEEIRKKEHYSRSCIVLIQYYIQPKESETELVAELSALTHAIVLIERSPIGSYFKEVGKEFENGIYVYQYQELKTANDEILCCQDLYDPDDFVKLNVSKYLSTRDMIFEFIYEDNGDFCICTVIDSNAHTRAQTNYTDLDEIPLPFPTESYHIALGYYLTGNFNPTGFECIR